MSNPDVFEVVLLAPRSVKQPHYLDLVEVSLLQQISERQDSFSLALANLQELRRDVSTGCASVARCGATSRSCSATWCRGP